MRKKILALLLVSMFVFVQVSDAYAKGFSGSRSSGGGHSYSRSSGYSGSKSSKSFGSSSSSKSNSGSSSSKGYSGSSSSKGYSGSSSSSSSSRNKAGSYSSGYSGSSSSKSGSSSSSSKSNTAKNSYMQDAYKKQASQNSYGTYKQNLNSDQQKVYNSSMNKNYKVNNRMGFEDAMRTRPQRINVYNSRPVIVNVNTYHFGSPFSYGYASVGPWDLWFLLRASDLFWYHHWQDIYPYRDYFQAAQFSQMEARIRALEAQNVARNDNYLDPGVDPDLQFSNDYQQKHLDNLYYTNKYPSRAGNPIATLFIVVIIVIVLIIILRKVSRPKLPKSTYNRIY